MTSATRRMPFPYHLLTIVLVLATAGVSRAAEAFPMRGYYTTFMRMPTFGLPEWKEMIDCMHEDGANTLLLWTAGAFRSKKFPITWKYNADHKNVEQDYVRELIDYAHSRRIKVLLGFTPFAYDGVNQYPLEHPAVKATQQNGQPASLWGMHAWGYNLCPSRTESQRFLREYISEMLFDFYPNADGLMIESSDYAICYCAECRGKFFDNEFSFVRWISDAVWKAKPDATIVVYPHYFSGRPVPGLDAVGARQKFDPRWTLFFTPHSAHIDTNLIAQARSSIYWNEGITLGTPAKLRDGARLARQHGISGFIPSLEPFSCVDGPPGSNKPRQKPFHLEYLREGEMPLNDLLVRVNRLAYRDYSRHSQLDDDAFRRNLGMELLSTNDASATADLLFVQECWFTEADWFSSPPLLNPAKVRERATREKWPDTRLAPYRQRVERLRDITKRYAESSNWHLRELSRRAQWIVGKWDAAK